MTDAVLIVDDEPSIRALMEQAFHLAGFAPVVASNGWQALRFLQSGGSPKVIVLDLLMPVMDGWAFRREQRADSRFADIPVVVVTASDMYRVEELGADVVMRKPMNVDEVVGVVRELVRTPRRPVAAR